MCGKAEIFSSWSTHRPRRRLSRGCVEPALICNSDDDYHVPTEGRLEYFPGMCVSQEPRTCRLLLGGPMDRGISPRLGQIRGCSSEKCGNLHCRGCESAEYQTFGQASMGTTAASAPSTSFLGHGVEYYRTDRRVLDRQAAWDAVAQTLCKSWITFPSLCRTDRDQGGGGQWTRV